MSRQMPWDSIPDSNIFATGDYLVQGIKLEEVFSKTGKLMYAMDVQVMDHPNTTMYSNMHFFENFVIGSNDDPEANVAGTWSQSVGAKRMKQMLTAAQVAEKSDMDKICAGFTGTQFIISISQYKEPETNRDGSPNLYAGQDRNNSTGFAKAGVKEPSIAGGQKTAVVQKPAPAPVAPPASPAMAAPAAPPAPAPAAPAPAAPAAPAAAPVTTSPVDANVQMLPCNVCGQQIPAAEFANHINTCLANQNG